MRCDVVQGGARRLDRARTVERAFRRLGYLGYVRASQCWAWIVERGSWSRRRTEGAMMMTMMLSLMSTGQHRTGHNSNQIKSRTVFGPGTERDKRKKSNAEPLDGDGMQCDAMRCVALRCVAIAHCFVENDAETRRPATQADRIEVVDPWEKHRKDACNLLSRLSSDSH